MDFRSHLSPTPWIWIFKEFENFRYCVKDKFRSAALFFSGLLILKPILLIMMYTPRLLLRSGITDGKSRPNVFRSAKWQEITKLLSICVYPSKLAEDVLGWVYRCTSIMWSVSGHLAELFPCLKSACRGDSSVKEPPTSRLSPFNPFCICLVFPRSHLLLNRGVQVWRGICVLTHTDGT